MLSSYHWWWAIRHLRVWSLVLHSAYAHAKNRKGLYNTIVRGRAAGAQRSWALCNELEIHIGALIVTLMSKGRFTQGSIPCCSCWSTTKSWIFFNPGAFFSYVSTLKLWKLVPWDALSTRNICRIFISTCPHRHSDLSRNLLSTMNMPNLCRTISYKQSALDNSLIEWLRLTGVHLAVPASLFVSSSWDRLILTLPNPRDW